MNWTERDEQEWENVQRWTKNFATKNQNDFLTTYNHWSESALALIPTHISEAFLNKLDIWIFHLHSLITSLQIQNETRERIISTARVYDDTIKTIEDMKKLSIDQLSFIAAQQTVRNRLYSLIQGGLTGTGKTIFIGSDFLLILLLNLRSIQVTAMVYGYDVKTPFELMSSLKVFHAATLPRHLKGAAWEELFIDLTDSNYFYEGPDNLLNIQWLQEPLKQLLKTLFITTLRKKSTKRPMISMAIGAGINYQLSKRVTEFADYYYKQRYLLEKGGLSERY